jgi:hypothetical protein
MAITTPNVSAVVDTSSIQKAIALASRTTTRTMEKLLGDTAYRVAWKAGKYTPFVSLSTIDEEMEATTTPVLSTRGARKGLPLKSGKNIVSMNGSGLNFAMKLVQARMNPNSPFNLATDQRWFLQNPHLSKVSLYLWLEQKAQEMVKARHSSTHFLQSGWKAVKQKIKAAGYRISGGAALGTSDDSNALNTINSSQLAQLGDLTRTGNADSEIQTITISNLVGTSSNYPSLDKEHNDALLDHGAPALQRAVDEQAEEMRDWNLNKDLEAELEAEWLSIPNAPAFQKGIHFNPIRAAEIQSVADISLGSEIQAFEF